MVHLGIRTMLSKYQRSGLSMKQDHPVLQDLPVDFGLATRFELSLIGPLILNNVGVIARKPEV